MLNLLGLQFSRRRFDHIHDFISVRQWVIVEDFGGDVNSDVISVPVETETDHGYCCQVGEE